VSTRILEGTYDGRKTRAVLVCGTTGTAFGPLFHGYDEAEAFLAIVHEYGYGDPRSIRSDILASFVRRFRAEREAAAADHQ
jgi:hypothetical protein